MRIADCRSLPLYTEAAERLRRARRATLLADHNLGARTLLAAAAADIAVGTGLAVAVLDAKIHEDDWRLDLAEAGAERVAFYSPQLAIRRQLDHDRVWVVVAGSCSRQGRSGQAALEILQEAPAALVLRYLLEPAGKAPAPWAPQGQRQAGYAQFSQAVGGPVVRLTWAGVLP